MESRRTETHADLLEKSSERHASLRHEIEHLAHFLPAQGPIEVFVHHNTLHAFEDRSFHAAVVAGAAVYGGQPYWPEDRYRQLLQSGRILISDLEAVLQSDTSADTSADPRARIAELSTRFEMRLSMLKCPLRTGHARELSWVIAETDALTRFQPEVAHVCRERMIDTTQQAVRELDQRDLEHSHLGRTLESLLITIGGHPQRWTRAKWEAVTLRYLWRLCRHGVRLAGLTRTRPRPLRVRDALLTVTGEDTDRYVHDLLIRFTSAFLDQGYATWGLPNRAAGYFRSFVELYSQPGPVSEGWLQGFRQELQALSAAQSKPLDVIADSLVSLGIAPTETSDFLRQSLLALGGWAGMVWQLESAVKWVNAPAPDGSLIEFLAVRMLLERQASEFVARKHLGDQGSLAELARRCGEQVAAQPVETVDQQAFVAFQVAQLMGWSPQSLERLSVDGWTQLLRELADFNHMARRRVYHEAFERRYRTAALDALHVHLHTRPQGVADQEASTVTRPAFQLVSCIDDREESFRRHLEEIAPDCETLSAAGFFAVAMNYLGAADAHYKPLCPAVVTPIHYVKEDVGYTFEGEHRRRAETRRWFGRLRQQFHSNSRTFLGGMATGLMGSLATFPLITRVLAPRLTSRVYRRVGALVQPPTTQLQLERYCPEPGPENGHVGYTLSEMTGIVERLLRDIGLTSRLSRLVVIAGHGSSSLNNPHESAYNCGACAGKRGGPNARAFAQMANDWRVRAELARRGITIPDDTCFLGSFHNTCDDSFVWFDLNRLPASHRSDFARCRDGIEQARRRNARERSRRFESARLEGDWEESLRHVEGRSVDLAQPRPEYNHATNAMVLVGRREWSRGLYLDRRAFLTSYDSRTDDAQCSILARILAAAVPVCAGISLEYYFSCVDPVVYGSGSKLPHNLVSLLGVMEGAASDLRTGLYQQMIEIHEPMRALFVIEGTPAGLLAIMDGNPVIGQLCRGGWVQLAVIAPEEKTLHLFRNGAFELYQPTSHTLPVATSSGHWFDQQRSHLGFAQIIPPGVSP